jgi:hypothetical protein
VKGVWLREQTRLRALISHSANIVINCRSRFEVQGSEFQVLGFEFAFQ